MPSNKVAIVTGAATGVGRACALKLAENGFSIVANFRTKETEILELMNSFESSSSHLSHQGDLSNPSVVSELVKATIERFGQIDVVVNAAGAFEEQDITKLNYEDWQRSWEHNLKINLMAPMNLAFCAAQYMLKQRSGKIINITSRGAFRGEPDAPAYGASKSGLNSASQSLAQALAPHGISVFAIAPGWLNTPLASKYLNSPARSSILQQSPLGRVGEPEEIAHLVLFLVGEMTDYLTGAIFDANGASYLRN